MDQSVKRVAVYRAPVEDAREVVVRGAGAATLEICVRQAQTGVVVLGVCIEDTFECVGRRFERAFTVTRSSEQQPRVATLRADSRTASASRAASA